MINNAADQVEVLQNMMERYDRVMTEKKVQVLLKASDKYAGCITQDGINIVIEVPGTEAENFVMAKALNLHELGHSLYTRPLTSDIRGVSLYEKMYNILEDQRIEWVMANKWPKMGKYFTIKAMTRNYDPELLWGRRHFFPQGLPKDKQPDDDWKQLIDSYLAAKSHLERCELIKEFVERQSQKAHEANGPVDPQNYAGGREGADETAAAKKAEKNANKEQSVEENEVEAQTVEQQAEEAEELAQAIEEMFEQSIDEINSEIKQIMAAGDGYGSTPSSFKSMNDPIDQGIVDELARVFKDTRVDLGMKVQRGLKSGSVDIRKVMAPRHGVKIFTKRQPADIERTKISLVTLIDVSGSMQSNDWNRVAARSVATMVAAATKAHHESAVIQFADKAQVVKHFHTGEMRISGYDGGTDARAAYNMFKVLKRSARHPVVLVIFTDGAFPEELVQMKTIADTKLYKIRLGSSNQKGWTNISSVNEMPKLLKKILVDVNTEKRKEIGR